jgi:hypothetical protein
MWVCSRHGISNNQVNGWSVTSHQTKGKGKARKKEKGFDDSDKERIILWLKNLNIMQHGYGYPSPCGKVLGGDVDEEEKELFTPSSHMDKKSVWEAIMAEKGEENRKHVLFLTFHGDLEEDEGSLPVSCEGL